jgi:hypothetical protein
LLELILGNFDADFIWPHVGQIGLCNHRFTAKKSETPLNHPLAQTLLANTITLTPRTLTLDIDDHKQLVHALGEKSARGVLDGSMEKRISPMIPQRWDGDDEREEEVSR